MGFFIFYSKYVLGFFFVIWVNFDRMYEVVYCDGGIFERGGGFCWKDWCGCCVYNVDQGVCVFVIIESGWRDGFRD